jgi:hypothetical protein
VVVRDARGRVANDNIDLLTRHLVPQRQHLVVPRVICLDDGQTLSSEADAAPEQNECIVRRQRLLVFEFFTPRLSVSIFYETRSDQFGVGASGT